MRRLLILLAILGLPAVALAQVPSTYTPQLITYQGVPTGVCSVYQIAENVTNGNYYTCNISTKVWQFVGTAGVASVSCGNLTNWFNCTVANPTTTPSLTFSQVSSGPVLDCTQFSGADMGAILNTCLAALPAAGGVADATKFNSPQTISTAVVNSFPATIVLCGISITQAANISLTGTGSSIVGCSNGIATLTKGANIDQITVSGTRNTVRYLNLAGATGSFSGNGIVLSGSSNADIEFNTVASERTNGISDAGTDSTIMFNNSQVSSGTSQLTLNDGTNAVGLFSGPPTTSLSSNLQVYFFGEAPGDASNIHFTSGSQRVGIGQRIQADTDVALWGHYTAVDHTDNITHAFIGEQTDAYYKVPVGNTNGNIQTAFEATINAYGAGNSAGQAVFQAQGQNTGSGTLTTVSGFNSNQNINTGGGAITNSYGFLADDLAGVAGTLNAAFFADTQTGSNPHYSFYDNSTANKDRFGLLSAVTISTETNCKANGTSANPSVVSCSAASAGMFSCATNASTGTCQVNTTAVTANSEIFITQDQADGGASQLNVTCNTTNVLNTSKPLLVSKSAGASFTINLGTVASNPACFEYHIVN